MKRLISLFVSATLIFAFLYGCASIVGKTLYPVTINSQPNQADIAIVDETGTTVFSGKTPTTVTLKSGEGYFHGKDYTVTFSKPGYAKHTVQIQRGLSGWYLAGNLLFGGLIGWFIVDPLTGAMWTLEQGVTATLSSGSSKIKPGEMIQIVTINDVPQELRSNMVPIK